MLIDASKLNHQLRIERPVHSAAIEGAGDTEWVLVADGVWADVQDSLPSRAERLDSGINVSSRPARVRMRYRSDIRPDMRFVIGSRIMEIVAGPAELGRREGLEFMVVDYGAASIGP